MNADCADSKGSCDHKDMWPCHPNVDPDPTIYGGKVIVTYYHK
jgi:hypothetical protein